ncbi:MAG: magnesium transporter [Phycisphaerae bacterium]|nr:magnesium transporter [Phycisphaerae bacterium]
MRSEAQELYDQIAELLEHGDDAALAQMLAATHPADVAEVFEVFDDEERSRLIFAMDPRMTAEVIVLLDEADRGEVVEDLDEVALTQIVSALPPDDAADVLGELDEEQREEILEHVPDEQADHIETLLEYPEDTAGGIMTPDLVALPGTATIAQATEAIRKASSEEIHYLYVVEDQGRLFGLVPLRRLVTNPPYSRLADICERDPVVVRVTDDQEEVVHKFRKYDVSAVPVIDDAGLLLGRITHDDVMDVLEEEADEDIYHMAGTDPTELETPSVVRAARIRFQWLLPAFVMMTLSAAVIMIAKSHLHPLAVGAILAFIPMIGAMGGNCGVQTSTIIIRGIASGDLAAGKLSLVFTREGRIALLMAPVCGLFSFTIAWIVLPTLQKFDEVSAGAFSSLSVAGAVGLGMGSAILVAAALGIVLPFFFRRIGVDPAIAAGPIVTTCNDVVSITVYLSISSAIVA